MVGVGCQKFPVLFVGVSRWVERLWLGLRGLWLGLGLLVRVEGLCLGFRVYG